MDLRQAYETLELGFDSPLDQVKKAFRNLSLVHHPDRAGNRNEFLQVKKAYDYILLFKGNESINPSSQLLQQLPPNEYNLELTLEEIFYGCTKTVKFVRKIIDRDTIEHKNVSIFVKVKPGCQENYRIIVPKAGDQKDGMIFANAVFIVRPIEHKLFCISKSTRFALEYTAQITNDQAVFGNFELKIPTLENEIIPLKISKSITRDFVERITNRGMPYPDVTNGKRGDLLVRFEIIKEMLPLKSKIEIELPLTLRDIYYGAKINQKLTTKTVDFTDETSTEENVLTIEVKPGTLAGTRFVFSETGNKYSGKVPVDVVFVAVDVPHPLFTRDFWEMTNVYLLATITKNEAENGVELELPTLEGYFIKKHFPGTITEGKIKKYGQGLIKANYLPETYGHLFVRFEVVDNSMKELIKEDINLTLEQIYNGYTKEVNYFRKITNLEGKESFEEKSMQFEIKPGTQTGTTYHFRRIADAAYRRIPADYEFTLKQIPHLYFVRNKCDIEYTAKLTLRDFNNKQVTIPTLGGGETIVHIDRDVIRNPIVRIPYLGLPDQKSYEIGDLVVKFEVVDADLLKILAKTYEYNLNLSLKEIVDNCYQWTPFVDNDGSRQEREITVKTSFVETKISYKVPNYETTEICIEKISNETNINSTCTSHRAQITLKEALCGSKVVSKKNNGIISIPKNQIINPSFSQIISQGRELLQVTCDIKFPKSLTMKQKAHLEQIFTSVPFQNYSIDREKIKVRDLFELSQQRSRIYLDKAKLLAETNVSVQRIILDLSLEQICVGYSGLYQTQNSIYSHSSIYVNLKPGEFKTISKSNNHYFRYVEFIVFDKPHPIFKRVNEVDIECTAVITLQEALCGFVLKVPTLENDFNKFINLSIGTDDEKVISFEDKYTIKGRGLPSPDNQNKRGNLIVSFEIMFPDELTPEQKNKIAKILL